MLKNYTLAISSSPQVPKALPLIALTSVTLGAALCALANMEFEACVLLFGYLITELATWPVA